MRLIVLLFSLMFFLFACEDSNAESSKGEQDEEKSEQEAFIEENSDEETNNVDVTEESNVEKEENELSEDVRFSGVMELTEDGVLVDATSNLPTGVEVTLRAMDHPLGGYPSQFVASERLEVAEDGTINGTVPFDKENFFERYKNEPIGLELRFEPGLRMTLKENADELSAFYGKDGENLEGPFVVELQRYDREEKPSYYISASGTVPARIGESYTIEEPVVGDPPRDQGETDVWMEAEIVDIDHRYIHIEGRSNLLYGTLLMGNIKSNEKNYSYQNAFSYNTQIKKDGTFTILLEYKSITDEGIIRLYSQAGFAHNRGKVVRDTYGEEFEKLAGEIVKPRYENNPDNTEYVIELIIPFNPEYEESPDEVDITQDGDEMKLILSDEILFEFGKSDITSKGDDVIQEVAEWLEVKEYKGLIRVHGHTDNVDGDDINQPLSEDRAANVHQKLESYLGDTANYEFEVEGFGKYEPIASNETDEGRQRNRRVEILLQEK